MKKAQLILSILTLASLNVFAQETILPPPIAEIILHADTAHGEVRLDPYSWIRNKENPAVIDYLKLENEYGDSIMAASKNLQDKLFQEMKGRIKEDDSQPPYKKGSYFYYERSVEDKDYKLICRKKNSLDAPEEILLDVNTLAEGVDYYSLGQYSISPDHLFLAYLYDNNGSERYSLKIKDLHNNKDLKENIKNVGNIAWATDNKTVFYTTIDSSSRSDKLYRHQLDTPSEDDPLIYNEKNDSYYLYPFLSKDEEYILIYNGSLESNEFLYLKADHPTDLLKVLFPIIEGVEYSVEHFNENFYILSNEWDSNFELFTVNANKPNKDNRKVIIPHKPDVIIESFDLFNDYLVCVLVEKGLKRLLVTQNSIGDQHFVDMEEDDYVIFPYTNKEFNTELFRYRYSSLTTPWTYYDYNFKTRDKTTIKQQEIPSGYNPKDYQSERIWIPSQDGVEIPVSIVYKKGFSKDGKNPMFLTAYGAYGSTFPAYFNAEIISLLDRGFVFGIAHIRGGGYLGKEWFNKGKLLNKKNSFLDFIACSEHFIKEGYTSSDKLAIEGGSAGGLLMGAVINMRPDLYHTVVAHVPWVDVLNDMFDPFLPATPLEWKHIGNPQEKVYYDYLKSYSPYDNVISQDYPNIYVTAGLNDPRVFFWEPTKWVAKLRTLKTDENIIILNTNFDSGHFGKTGRFDAVQKRAEEFAFILKSMHIDD
jgi:oligopeptidase B